MERTDDHSPPTRGPGFPPVKSAIRLPALIAILLLAAVSPAVAQAPTDPSPPIAVTPTFRDLLIWADILPQALGEIPATVPTSEDQRHLLEQVLFRLARADVELFDTAIPWRPSSASEADAPQLGDVVELRGRIVKVERVPAREYGADDPSTFRSVMDLAEEQRAVIWTNHVPAEWLRHQLLNERAAVRGAFAGRRGTSPPGATVILADRVAWHPDNAGLVETTPGRRILGNLGVDVGRLDDLEHRETLLRNDREPFYGMLAAVKQTEPRELLRAARAGLDSYVGPWHELPSTAPHKRRQLARVVIDAASNGRYSVAPLFLDAENQTGQLLLLEGTARRAIRINADHALGEYYELEIFTPDSQNLPVVCCVPSLPADFPLGDAIREPVRLAGFFFKLWRYDSRAAREAGRGPLTFEPAAAPLVIAAEPQWPLARPRAASEVLGWIIAGVFLAAVAAIGGLAWWWSRDHRRNRRRLHE